MALKTMNIAYLVTLAVLLFSITIVTGQSTNCTAEYMNDLLKQALEVKEQCDLKGRYDCCQVQTLAKLVQLHTPQTGVYEVTDPCKSDEQITQLVQMRCDLGQHGGGWTVILRRRQNGPRTTFNRGWDDYENGFGDPNNEFWIGLRNLHCLTRRDDVDLIIDLRRNDGNGMTWSYDHFKIAGSNENYRLTIGKGIGPTNGYDAMSHLNQSQFTTRDSDHDLYFANCAQNTGAGGWWHTNCYYVQLTGTSYSYIFWYKGSGTLSQTSSSYYDHYENVEMKIRPKNCNNEC